MIGLVHCLGNYRITLPLYICIRNKKNDKLNSLSDEEFARQTYMKKCGKSLDLKNPKTFDEKVWWLKLYDRNSLYQTCSDKLAVRDYVRSLGLEEILTPIGKERWNSYKDVDFSALPDKCMIKCNHTSGCNMLWDKKKPFDYKKFRREFAYWMQRDYFYSGREYNYKGIDRKIFWEEFIESDDKAGLTDWRFMCFGGQVKFVMVDIGTMDTGGGHSLYAKRNVYDRDFNLMPVKVTRENFPPDLVQKPDGWESMLEIAEKLSKPFIHCRVDLYNIHGKILFGEITFHHAGACNKITPEEKQLEWGSLIKLPEG